MASNTEITEQPSSEKVTDPTGTPLQHITPPPTVQIWELKPHQAYSHGTGFIFDKDGHVATAAHVLEDSKGNILPRLGIHTEAGNTYTAHLEKLDDINDLAILKIDVGTPQYIPPLKLAPKGSDLKPNDPLRIWGYPQDVARAYIAPAIFWGKTQLRNIFTGSADRDACLSHAADAYVSSVSPDERKDGLAEMQREVIVTSAIVEPGLSGGMALAAKDGINNELVGIQDLSIGPADPGAILIPAHYLTALMNDQNSKFSFTYKPDSLFPTGFFLSSVKRSDGSTTPPYHMQMYDFIRKRCDSFVPTNF